MASKWCSKAGQTHLIFEKQTGYCFQLLNTFFDKSMKSLLDQDVGILMRLPCALRDEVEIFMDKLRDCNIQNMRI